MFLSKGGKKIPIKMKYGNVAGFEREGGRDHYFYLIAEAEELKLYNPLEQSYH